jgi:hypothetical protein
MDQRLNSEDVLDIVGKHKESVEGYVRRHDLDIYQINKLIKAETSMQDRNSILNFLRKKKEKIIQKQPRDQALKQDLREEHVNRESGQETLNNLKDDLIDIRQQVTEINTDAVDHNTEEDDNASMIKAEQGNQENNERHTGESNNVLPEGVKSRRKLEEEVEHHFDSLPSDMEDSGIVSRFRDLISGEEDVSDVVDLEPVDIFEEIEGKSDREKAVKAAYTVKKCLENSRGEHLGYGEISSLVRNGELPVSSGAMADLFNYLSEYDYGAEFDFDEVDEAVSNCRALVHRLS